MNTMNEMIKGQLQRVINKILFMKKKSLFLFQGVELYPSEVHLMLLIKGERATNATKMAAQLGVTKGAVSQTLSRLEKKGYVEPVDLNRSGRGRNGYQVSERFFNIWYLMRNGPRRAQHPA